MNQKNRYGIISREDLMGQDWEKYRVTKENCLHRMGSVTLELPENTYRMPYEGGSEYSMFSWTNVNGIESTLFCDRIDESVDDILQVACTKSTSHEMCLPCRQKQYVINALKPYEGEVVTARGKFSLNNGTVHTLTSAPTTATHEQTGLFYTAYQALFFLNEIGNGPAIKIQHGLAAQSYFCHRLYETKEIEDLSQILYDTLSTIEIMPDKMMIN